jgi:arabinogalactan oligomer/maltooligosaccharide transport system permease protein
MFGFLIAFTSISGNKSMIENFDWVGFQNFVDLFDFSSTLGSTFGIAFWRVLGWTIVWAIFSTATVFFGGFFQAVIINNDHVPLKKFWRTVLILPWAMPALLSQMVFSVMFDEKGFINEVLKSVGAYDFFINLGWLGTTDNPLDFTQLVGIDKLFYMGPDNIQWFNNPFNPTFVRITLVVVNIWLGFPYFMALMSGIMTSIDKSLYEAAKIDGATRFQLFRFLTFPLVMYSTAPILIMTFSGNFNNFGVIYFITQGGPNEGRSDLGYAGDTDILISWMYNLTVTYSIYNMASVFSVLIFIFVGSVTAYNLSKTRAFKED